MTFRFSVAYTASSSGVKAALIVETFLIYQKVQNPFDLLLHIVVGH